MKSFIVIGMGRFGSSVARELCDLGNQVLAVDLNRDKVQDVADSVTRAVIGDARDPAVLHSLGIKEYDCAVVAIGSDVGNSALVTMRLIEAGVPQVVCKARSHVHKRLLEKLGANRVIFPEYEMGIKLAQGLDYANIIDYIELSPDYGIVEIDLPGGWAGKSIRDLNVRAKYQVNVIAIRRGQEVDISPSADSVFRKEDRILVLGEMKNISAVCGK